MKHLLNRLEPLIWLLFGGGIMGGTILITGWILVVGILAPLGMIEPGALDYGRAHMLAASLPGRVLLGLMIALPLWKGAHHLRHLSIDSGRAESDTVVAPILYLIATLGSIAAIVAVVRL